MLRRDRELPVCIVEIGDLMDPYAEQIEQQPVGVAQILIARGADRVFQQRDAVQSELCRERSGLADVIRRAGFGIELLKFFDVLGVFPWLIAGRVLRQSKHHEGAAQIYDRFAVPVGRRIESRVAPPFGKNLIAIARRP